MTDSEKPSVVLTTATSSLKDRLEKNRSMILPAPLGNGQARKRTCGPRCSLFISDKVHMRVRLSIAAMASIGGGNVAGLVVAPILPPPRARVKLKGRRELCRKVIGPEPCGSRR